MELRHLRYFIAVAEELHFGNAAKRLKISQPPLSQQIKQLEEEIKTKLFHRTNKKVELTEAGKVFYDNAVRVLQDLHITIEDVQSIASGIKGELKLGFSGSAAIEILPPILKASEKLFPEMSLEISQLTTAEQVKALENRELDIGILVPPVDSPIIKTERFKTEEFVVCLPESHPLAKQHHKVHIHDLKHDRFIMAPKSSGPGYYDSIMAIFDDAHFTPNISQTANEQLTMVAFVASGLGVAIVSESTQAIQIKGVTYKQLSNSHTKTNVMAWNTRNSRPILKHFLNFLRQEIIPLFQAPPAPR